MTPRIGVVMAARNYAAFLPTAVRSVIAQTVADWELVIIDDGSTDATSAAAAPFLGDRRIRYVRTESRGQPAAKNLGIRLTSGEFVAFLDADDAWLPVKLERQLAAFAAAPELGVVSTLRTLMDATGNPLPTADERPPRGWCVREMYRQNAICFSSVMVRREVFDRVGLFDERRLDLAIDYDLWLRAATAYPFGVVDEPLVNYRVGHANLSSRVLDRIATVCLILRRADARAEVAAEVPARDRRAALADVLAEAAILQRFHSVWESLRLAARAVWLAPRGRFPRHALKYAAFSGIVRWLLPGRAVNRDWARHYTSPRNDPANV